ncbi:carbamoyl-phosphate synthase small subunit [Pelagirhabdus alkalitolerans]|uniref:Carbamoyl phosphate synthase small chain n=1 Tax=Pelagirhabdus alkalitolerans TaxID=1612202 RepID=A0A1G6JJK6_9BACI|nr:carbamoyl phosphate synthase small subunit [Pelagirhabdus alkalitolerans]SDC18861.1 carbamoyl-phosphate synthase small subunit [Pelagirhabdus alkalitolerans]
MEIKKGYLVLSTGDVLEGKYLGDVIKQEGELVFNTAMTGYQEVITDPSYAGQIVTLTYPLIGNYGCHDQVSESVDAGLAGLIIATPCINPQHAKSMYSLVEYVEKVQLPTLYDVDTRALTKIIRKHGEVYGKITDSKDDTVQMSTVHSELVKRVSTPNIQSFKQEQGSAKAHCVVIDYGYKKSIVDALIQDGCDVTIVPFNTTYETIQSLDPDGVVFSNGPGDPKHLSHQLNTIKQIAKSYPSLGICLGHQLVALAFGANTKRLPYGHRGSNHPVKDLQTGKVMVTSQNHGYVVDAQGLEATELNVTHVNVNDQSVEGLNHEHHLIQTVQFHPEAHPGPVDTHYLFNQFVKQLENEGAKQHA